MIIGLFAIGGTTGKRRLKHEVGGEAPWGAKSSTE